MEPWQQREVMTPLDGEADTREPVEKDIFVMRGKAYQPFDSNMGLMYFISDPT